MISPIEDAIQYFDFDGKPIKEDLSNIADRLTSEFIDQKTGAIYLGVYTIYLDKTWDCRFILKGFSGV